MSLNDEYMKLNENDNAFNSLKVAQEFLEKDDIYKWKWASIAIHHALYSFCISALVHGNYDNVISSTKDDKSDWFTRDDEVWMKLRKEKVCNNRPYYRLIWQETNEKPPEKKEERRNNKTKKNKKRLIGFWTALARVMDGEYWMGRLCCTKPLVLSDVELEKIYFVVEYVRNDIVHFIPKTIIHNIDLIKKGLLIMVVAIEFFVKESKAMNLQSIFIDKSNLDYDFEEIKKYLTIQQDSQSY